MWAGYEFQLCEYGKIICSEWIGRGYQDSLLQWFIDRQKETSDTGLPPWIGDERFHEAHRSKLMSKKPELYNFPNTRDNLPYQHPVLTDTGYYLKVIV